MSLKKRLNNSSSVSRPWISRKDLDEITAMECLFGKTISSALSLRGDLRIWLIVSSPPQITLTSHLADSQLVISCSCSYFIRTIRLEKSGISSIAAFRVFNSGASSGNLPGRRMITLFPASNPAVRLYAKSAGILFGTNCRHIPSPIYSEVLDCASGPL